jgi:hypothetical protein
MVLAIRDPYEPTKFRFRFWWNRRHPSDLRRFPKMTRALKFEAYDNYDLTGTNLRSLTNSEL